MSFSFIGFKVRQQANFFEQLHAQSLRLVNNENSDFIFLVDLNEKSMQLRQDSIFGTLADINSKICNTGAEELCRAQRWIYYEH